MRESFARFTITIASVVLLFTHEVCTAHDAEPQHSKAIEALKALETKTGKTADQLLPAIEIYASMIEILAEDLESGAVKKEELTDLKVIMKNLSEEMEHESSMDATTKLVALRMLNAGNTEKLKDWLRTGIAEYYKSILEEPETREPRHTKALWTRQQRQTRS